MSLSHNTGLNALDVSSNGFFFFLISPPASFLFFFAPIFLRDHCFFFFIYVSSNKNKIIIIIIKKGMTAQVSDALIQFLKNNNTCTSLDLNCNPMLLDVNVSSDAAAASAAVDDYEENNTANEEKSLPHDADDGNNNDGSSSGGGSEYNTDDNTSTANLHGDIRGEFMHALQCDNTSLVCVDVRHTGLKSSLKDILHARKIKERQKRRKEEKNK